MMKSTIACCAVLLLASAAFADGKQDTGPSVITGGLLDCTGATPLTCGEAAGGTVSAGGVVTTYGCTTLSYSGCQEAVYEICLGGNDNLTVTMTYTHSTTNDLDAFLLGSCNEANCLDSSLATNGTEVVELLGAAAGTYYVVIDGWNSGTGGRCNGTGHTVTVTCSSPCTPVSIEQTTWGDVKGLYKE